MAQAVDNHRCIACGHDRPVLEPLAIASSLSICPSCDEALHQELRNAYSRENQSTAVRDTHRAGNSNLAYVLVVELDCEEKAQ